MEEQIKPVARAGRMPGTDGFTMAVFHADQVPVDSPLYSQQSIEALRADYERAEGLALRSIERRMAMEAEADSLRADAERYRWLRDLPEDSPHECIGNMPGDMWDDAIDAGMQGEE